MILNLWGTKLLSLNHLRQRRKRSGRGVWSGPKRLSAAVVRWNCLNADITTFTSRFSVPGLPRMDLSGKIKMSDSLCKFGVTDAFSPMLADFSGLGVSSVGRVYLKEVLHFVRLKVDEDGSEGSAVTIALPEAAAFMEEKINYFRADHPFVLLLRDKLTGAVLFAAVVNDLPAVKQMQN